MSQDNSEKIIEGLNLQDTKRSVRVQSVKKLSAKTNHHETPRGNVYPTHEC